MTVMTEIGTMAGQTIGLHGSANVRTPCGPRHVSNLRTGDLVVTRDNGLQPVRMVFGRTVSQAEMAADPSLAPIRLKPRCIGPMMPQRDLLIAGDHRILIPGYRLADQPDTGSALILARDIAGTSDGAYVDRSFDEVVYYNLVFDAQQVFSANGLPVESFHVSDRSIATLDRKVRGDLEQVFPDLRSTADHYPTLRYPVTSREQYLSEYV